MNKRRGIKTLGLVTTCVAGALAVASSVSGQDSVPIFVSGRDRDYEQLRPGSSVLVTVRGPGELRLLSRARFRPELEDGIDYSLKLRVNGGAEEVVAYSEVARSRTAMFRDGTLGVPGRLMDHKLELGRGYHNVEIGVPLAGPQIFFRHLFTPTRPKRQSWVSIAPIGETTLVELVSRESVTDYHRNAPNRPFSLDVIGPTQLRVFTRLENTPEMRGRIHYRLQVRLDGLVTNTFQLSSRRSEITTYRSSDELVPGRAAEVVVTIPAGRHRVEIDPLDPDKSTLLARFMLPREDLSLTEE